MADDQVLAQIARLEQELARIHGELVELRARVGGHGSSAPRRRTQTFAAITPNPRDAPTRELPAQPEAGRPAPAVPAASETVPTARTASQSRRHAGRRTGLTEFPPMFVSEAGTEATPEATSDQAAHQPTHPSAPRVRLEDRAGRYVYFDEAATPPRDGKPKQGRR